MTHWAKSPDTWLYNEDNKDCYWGASIVLDAAKVPNLAKYAPILTGRNRAGIFFDFQHKPGRIIISGFYPNCKHGSPNERAESITVSVDKAGPEIVKDMMKRFVPQYIAALIAHCDKAIADVAQDDRHEKLVAELIKDMAGTGSPWPQGSNEAVITMTSKTPIGGTIHVQAWDQPSAQMDLRSVPWNAAKRICAILAECRSDEAKGGV